MKSVFRTAALFLVGVLATQPLSGQLRTLTRTRTLAPIASTTLSPVGGYAILENVPVRAVASDVGVNTGGYVGAVGRLEMRTAFQGAPGSKLYVFADGLAAGPYSLSVDFTRAAGGESVRIVDRNTGSVLVTCTLQKLANYDDTQGCTGSLQHPGGNLQILVEPTAGLLYPMQITVAHLQG